MKHRVRYLVWMLAACAGCEGDWSLGRSGGDPAYLKPTIAVMKFENRAGFGMGWNLGDGMRDVLVDRLMATGRFQVIERPEIGSVVQELQMQNSGMTREQSRAQLGRIKNAQYLIKGTVTDFGHVSQSSAFAGTGGWDLFGSGTRAVMSVTIYVVEVESAEIIHSESISESVRASDTSVKATYQGVSFGGTTFYTTPLGRATEAVIDKAIKHVAKAIANRPWEPKVALVQEGIVVVTGGKDRGVEPGTVFEVYEPGAPVRDPDTGDLIAHQPGKTLGRLRVNVVHEKCCQTEVITGKLAAFQVGQKCRKVKM